LALTLPAAVALCVVPTPLVSVLFERGAFDASDTAATAVVLAIYGLGLPAFVLQKVLQPLFYAREDTRSPFRYAVVAMAINAAIAIGLAPVIGYLAAALATTLAAWAMVWLLWRGSRRMGDVAQLDDRFRSRAPRIVLASAAMGGLLVGFAWLLGEALSLPALRYAALAALIAVGIVGYFATAHIAGALRIGEIRAALRR